MTEPPEETQAAAAETAPSRLPSRRPRGASAVEEPPSRFRRRINPGRSGHARAFADSAPLAEPSRRPWIKRHHGLVRLIALGQRPAVGGHDRQRRRSTWPSPTSARAADRITRTRGTASRFHFSMRLGGCSPADSTALRPGVAVRPQRAALPRHRRSPANGGRCCSVPGTCRAPANAMLSTYACAKSIRRKGKHNALQKLAYSRFSCWAFSPCSPGSPSTSPPSCRGSRRSSAAISSHATGTFWAVWIFVAFTLVHVTLVLVVDPASLRAMITGWVSREVSEP